MTRFTPIGSDLAATVTLPSLPVVASQVDAQAAEIIKPAASAAASHDDARDSAANSHQSAESLRAVAAQIEKYLQSHGRSLEFSVDEDSGKLVVSVRDKHTGELIRQIPNEETLRLARSLGAQPNALIDLEV